MTQLPPFALGGLDCALQPLPGGHRNLAFRTLGLAQDLVFKSTRRSPQAIAWLGRVHRLARQAGFAVPALRPSRRGALVEAGWTCEPFVQGRPFAAADLPGLLPQITAFHRLAADLPQRPGFASSQALLRQGSGGDVDLVAMPRDLAEICRQAWRAIGSPPETVVHGDLTAGNLLHGPGGRPALLDWDECRRDLPLFDLAQLAPQGPAEQRACLAWEVACSWQIEPDHARRLATRLWP